MQFAAGHLINAIYSIPSLAKLLADLMAVSFLLRVSFSSVVIYWKLFISSSAFCLLYSMQSVVSLVVHLLVNLNISH
jgi:hypothetical protein